jgi:peptidoglycan/xylan/chitin deacetylase (PgdA/CDA1 family)
MKISDKRSIVGILLFASFGIFLFGAILSGRLINMPSKSVTTLAANGKKAVAAVPDENIIDYCKIISEHEKITPELWGDKLSGVVTGLDTGKKLVALTFDACGGSPRSNGYDAKLIDFLIKEKIPATLFVTGRWIDANPQIFQNLACNNLLEIENHGLNHKPASVNGRSAYGIKGCSSVGELINEIDENGKKIELLTGRNPVFYRSGTNYYDEVAVEVASDLGYKIVSYNVLGDAGATFNRKQVREALITAPAGAIIILHMNHPEGETAEGVMDAIPIMLKNGFGFVKLSDCALKQAGTK